MEILDIGTGSGFFAVLLSEKGHHVQGIDLTPAMLKEASALAEERRLTIIFRQMDAQNLSYGDECFDAVVSRNLTWTLPEPEKAYREWFRVLKKGGILLNFDASYGEHVRSESTQNNRADGDSPYGHIGMTREMEEENRLITLAMEISRKTRPCWDQETLLKIGFQSCETDVDTGKRVLGSFDLLTAPMFGIHAVK